MQLLKIKLRAPSAHYRIPHSSNPHCTYPVPPYSTAIGILCNILGDKEGIASLLDEDFALGMLSRYGSVTREYVWYRNLNPDMHRGRYLAAANRRWQENPDHPGGQSPIQIDVLNDVQLIIYLWHRDEVLDQIISNAGNPQQWRNHIHLGRAEDWAIPVQIQKTELELSQSAELTNQANQHYQWLPKLDYYWDTTTADGYRFVYERGKGTVNLVSAKYRFVNPHTGELSPVSDGAIRDFSYILAKIGCASVPFQAPALLVDTEEKSPVYLARIKGAW